MRKIAVLCDFDGTVAQDDVGNALFRRFARGDTRPIVDAWKEGKISSRDCLEREASLARASADELLRFINERRLDPYFKDFVDFARRRGIEIVVVSDGLDHYIEQMLMRAGVGDIESFANTLQIAGDRLKVTFPYFDVRDCRDCGNCKTYHLEKYKQSGYYVVYVGNGLSDRCPSTFSDFVFAKGELLEFCRSDGVDYVPFENFRDVEREILRRFVLNNELGKSIGGA